MQACERTFVDELPIDYELACRQHGNYCQVLSSVGLSVQTLDANLELPDCAFVEDPAIVLDEAAILTSMGADSRVAELKTIATELEKVRRVLPIHRPARLEGGDVLRVGRTLLVGISSRTNEAGALALADLARPYGYLVKTVKVTGSLHLKTACTALPDNRLLVNPNWIDISQLGDYDLIAVPTDEPWGANTLPVSNQIIMPAAHQQTQGLLADLGFDLRPIDISEFAKAEGGVTCLSLVFS
jgi:dimethylargininase